MHVIQVLDFSDTDFKITMINVNNMVYLSDLKLYLKQAGMCNFTYFDCLQCVKLFSDFSCAIKFYLHVNPLTIIITCSVSL